MGADAGFLGLMGPEMGLLLPMLDERSRRLVLGAVARAAGDGGTGAVASLTGASWQTVADGAAEVGPGESAPPGRVRRAGAGRRRLEDAGPGLLPALEALVADSVRGDPESPLTWTTRSVKHLAQALTEAGHPCSPVTAWRLLRRSGYTLQSNSKAAEGRQHPERDAQFRYTAAQAKGHMAAGQPVISVDAKKREQAGNYGRPGRERAPAGEPVTVRSHDFPDKDGKHAIPYGACDEAANTGFVNVGTGASTAALAVEPVRRWRRLAGKDACPGAARLLVTAGAGGSSGHRARAWKAGLAELARETGLDITVCHFPPGTSKWNKTGHRLFCQISLAWRGRPLTSYDVIVSTIGAVTTGNGLACTAVLDENRCPTGAEVSDAEVKHLEGTCLTRHAWHGDWNCTLPARPAPPPPAPPARPPRPVSQDALSRPALTGLPPGATEDLAAELEIPCRARLGQDAFLKRGRRPAGRAGGQPRLTDVAGNLVITRLRDYLGLPCTVIAALFAIHPSGASRQSLIIRDLLAARASPLPPPASPPPERRLRTMQDLREYAASHGIEINLPPPTAETPRMPR